MTKAQARKNSVRKPCRSNCRCGACSAISTDFQPKLWALLCPSPFLYFLLLGLGFPDSSVGKESACNAGDSGSVPGTGRFSGEGIGYLFQYSWTSLVAELVKNPPAVRETWVRTLGWEDPLEKGKDPTPVFWPGEFHGLYSPRGHRVRHN